MRPNLALTTALVTLLAAPALADEGMWTFDAFPTARVAKAYGSAPDRAWLDRVRASAVRLTGGCSASVVSGEGLVLTNNHCVVDCAQALSTASENLFKDGYVAGDRARERKCPGQQAEIVTAISDVTPDVQRAIGAAKGEALVRARDAAVARIEAAGCTDKATQRCQVVTLFGGGQYKLYRYRKYSDVRLVFAPEFQAAFFGGDPDNFNFPRYDVDAAFLRLYENGRPVATPAHLRWAPRAPKVGEVTYVVGNPGSTRRLLTQAQFAMERDAIQPGTLLYLSELRGRLIAAMADDADKTRTGSETLFSIENSFKARYGQQQALVDPDFAARLAAGERELRAKIAADPALAARIGDPWGEVAKAVAAYQAFYPEYAMLEGHAGLSDLMYYARTLVRAAQERAKPDGERLPEYHETELPLIEKDLTDPRPTYPWLERLKLEYWLSKTRERLTSDAPQVRNLLGRESPEALAKRLVTGTRLADPAERKRLYDGGLAAIRASNDPLIEFALKADPDARAVRQRYRAEYDAPVTAAQSRLALARFAAYGDTVYPDATFTLRISYGAVQGWTYRGKAVKPTTDFAGLYTTATGAPPYDLTPRWTAAKAKLGGSRVLNFVTTNDIIGGNSGSPVIAADGSVIGAAFDGNIHSLGGAYGYDGAVNRTVVVSTGAVEEELEKVYPAPALLEELRGG